MGARSSDFDSAGMHSDPIAWFAEWFAKASQAGIPKHNAMTLATVAPDGRPSARIVLLSSFDARGFVFHTNYESEKAVEIARNPWVALTFWWDPLGWQVRIEGRAERTTAEESDAYFANRPRGSQLGAWASDQSRTIESRAVLETRVRQLDDKYRAAFVPRPPYWGGYRVRPYAIEFWEDRQDRLHERVRFERGEEGDWRSLRLAP
ncbi:MAG: pyridoxamine 5'-phosphate oxidase [Sulfurifustis sp.]